MAATCLACGAYREDGPEVMHSKPAIAGEAPQAPVGRNPDHTENLPSVSQKFRGTPVMMLYITQWQESQHRMLQCMRTSRL